MEQQLRLSSNDNKLQIDEP